MSIQITSDLSDEDREQFDQLDNSAGSSSCYQRMLQRHTDGRWHARYLRWREGGQLRALVPLYRSRGTSLPDPAYDPANWAWPNQPADKSGQEYLLVGGCADYRTGLHADAGARAPAELRRLLTRAAQAASEDGLCLAFPFMYSDAMGILAEVTSGAATWTLLGREAWIRGLAAPDWEEQLPSKVRYVLRRDRRLIREAGLLSGVTTWPEVKDWASILIAEHNIRKGQFDQPDFVHVRYEEWQRTSQVELIAFTVTDGDFRGVLTALIWQDQLELYEIGLSGRESPGRLAAYLALLFHLPFNLAADRGLAEIRAGLAAEIPKNSRGAELVDLYGGILGAADTQRLAHGKL
jgi:hypothetical protein